MNDGEKGRLIDLHTLLRKRAFDAVTPAVDGVLRAAEKQAFGAGVKEAQAAVAQDPGVLRHLTEP